MAGKPLAHRGTGGTSLASEDDAVPDIDTNNTSGLLLERLQAWKHACGYLESYISATEKVHKAHAKEYEKILKSVSDPLKEGHHFDQTLGGIAGLFENIRSNTHAIANSHLETEKNLKGTVLPILGRLHTEIKHKSKELSGGAVKSAKNVEKARNITQQHIELLGQHTGGFSTGAKVEHSNDPYVIQRGVNHRLHKQVLEENNNRHDLLAVQDSFAQFEAHLIQTIQQAMAAFLQNVGGQAERQKAMYSDITAATQQIPLDFEWNGFIKRNGAVLIDPSSPKRDISRVTFPNQDHPSTMPLIAGTLERKHALKGYSTGYYAVTPSKYLHEFKDNDDVRRDPTPELSLYLPDCIIGATNGVNFNIKGKDASKGKVGGAFAMSHEYQFKAKTPTDAEKWSTLVREASSAESYAPGLSGSTPTSPVVDRRNTSGVSPPPQYQEEKKVAPVQTQGLPLQSGQQSGTIASAGDFNSSGTAPNSAAPVSQTPIHGAGGLPTGITPTSAAGAPLSGAEGAPTTKEEPFYHHVPKLNVHVHTDMARDEAARTSGKNETDGSSTQTTSRDSDFGGGYAEKRGHIPQLSITDPNHHVTEAIGDMYGDHHYGNSDPRPLSFITSSVLPGSQNSTATSSAEAPLSVRTTTPLIRTTSSERMTSQPNGYGAKTAGCTNSVEQENGAPSSGPSFRERTNAETSKTHFPLSHLGYESDPAAVAQELSNLQALRRMSMDVNGTGDPDLVPFNTKYIPAAPSGSADEDDRARLFWVPARIHPELAPTEFKTFIDNRVKSIKRRSEERNLSPDGSQQEGSGLRRKKSMLSRQIDNTSSSDGADGYSDGAELLDSKTSQPGGVGIEDLQDLEALISGPSRARQKLSIDTQSSLGSDKSVGDDMPILPNGPGGNALRRSTRTTYRRGSLRKVERAFPKRAVKYGEGDGDESPISSPTGDFHGLIRVQTEPYPSPDRAAENFSRPGRSRRDLQTKSSTTDVIDETTSPPSSLPLREKPSSTPAPKHFVSQISSNGRKLESPFQSISKISQSTPNHAETHAPSDEARQALKPGHIPERVSSHEPPPGLTQQGALNTGLSSTRGPVRPGSLRQNQNEKGNQTLKDMASHPSPLPGNSTRTDSLSFIPTLTEDKKSDPKKPKDKKEKDTSDVPKKSSWSWGSLLGTEEKEKEKKRDDETKRARSKTSKPIEKSHDNTRLDLLQTTMEGSRGRESLVLDRSEVKLDDERKKDGGRKHSGEGKREKDTGLFSALFGGKKKTERETTGKKQVQRNLSPDPPQRILKPDVDYSWTRFSILEERAIYRLAHMKLANPRRALHSQVLLSNFMYSYLAKVQQMHPHIQIPQVTMQKQQKKVDQPDEYSQYQKYQEHQQRQQEEDEQAELHQQDSGDDGHYEYGHSEYDQRNRPQSRASLHDPYSDTSSTPQHNHGGGANQHNHAQQAQQAQQQQKKSPPQMSSFQYQKSQFDEPGRSQDEMW